jgi:hypothetical protein
MPIIFPDLELIIVNHLVAEFDAVAGEYGSVRVGTKKTAPGQTVPDREVVITANYTSTTQDMIRDASAVIDVYSNDYAEASLIGNLTAALITTVTGDSIKRAVVTLGPVRMAEEGPAEKRSLYIDFTVKGSEL